MPVRISASDVRKLGRIISAMEKRKTVRRKHTKRRTTHRRVKRTTKRHRRVHPRLKRKKHHRRGMTKAKQALKLAGRILKSGRTRSRRVALKKAWVRVRRKKTR